MRSDFTDINSTYICTYIMIKKIKSWFTANKLTLNVSMTPYILITPKRQMQETCLKLYFDNNITGEHK